MLNKVKVYLIKLTIGNYVTYKRGFLALLSHIIYI